MKGAYRWRLKHRSRKALPRRSLCRSTSSVSSTRLSLQQVQGALDRKPEKKVDLGGGKKDKDESSDEGGSGKGKQVIIHKLLVPVDLKKIKDLQQLLALLQEVEDYAAANEDGEPGDDEDAVPAPA